MDTSIYDLVNNYEKQLARFNSVSKLATFKISIANDDRILKKLKLLEKHLGYVGFFYACLLDLASTLIGLSNVKTNWQTKFYLKNSFLLIYESIVTFEKHQKEMQEFISLEHNNFIESFKAIQLDLKKFKKTHNYSTSICKFRNKAGAHYDENFKNYIEQLYSIDNPESFKMISDFISFLTSLLRLWDSIVNNIEE